MILRVNLCTLNFNTNESKHRYRLPKWFPACHKHSWPDICLTRYLLIRTYIFLYRYLLSQMHSLPYILMDFSFRFHFHPQLILDMFTISSPHNKFTTLLVNSYFSSSMHQENFHKSTNSVLIKLARFNLRGCSGTRYIVFKIFQRDGNYMYNYVFSKTQMRNIWKLFHLNILRLDQNAIKIVNFHWTLQLEF